MMPTLLGRWQTRLMLFLIIGMPVSLLFAWGQGAWRALAPEPFALVIAMLAVGLVLDIVYQELQRFRWDQDWPFALYALGLVVEFAIVLFAARNDWLPGVDACRLARIDRVTRQLVCVNYSVPLDAAIWQFVAIFALTLIFVIGVAQTLFTRWRFNGGEFGRFRTHQD